MDEVERRRTLSKDCWKLKTFENLSDQTKAVNCEMNQSVRGRSNKTEKGSQLKYIPRKQ